jgi:chromosome segregation ATPase
VDQLESDLKEEKGRSDALLGELGTFRSARESLEAELADAKAGSAKDAAKVEILTARLDSAEGRIATLTGELAEAKVALRALQSKAESSGATSRPAGASESKAAEG